jgi:hypothetical protein
MKAPEFSASRTALVASTATSSGSKGSYAAMYSPTVFATSSIASVARWWVVSTPRPSRVTVERRSSSFTLPSSTSATTRRVEFVPMSTTATRTSAAP